MKVVQVCKPSECDNTPFKVKVGKKNHTFCCEKGFEKSLKAFSKTINPSITNKIKQKV